VDDGKDIRELALGAAEDAGRDFASYDRREDEDLGQGDLLAAVAGGDVSMDEIAAAFLRGAREAGLG
jgi:hypothetical protein